MAMAKNRFNKIKGTKDFLVLTVVFTFLCLWAIRDAWFPTEKTLKKHPLTFAVTSNIPGVVQSVPVEPGQKIEGTMVLVQLAPSSYQKAVDVAEEAYKKAKESGAPGLSKTLISLHKAKERRMDCTIRNTDFTLTTTYGEELLHGKVLEVFAEPALSIEAGETLLKVQPKDTFYVFNQTLAVISFIVALAGLCFHRMASK